MAIHKFASWNKTTYLELIVPKLAKEELNGTSPDGQWDAIHICSCVQHIIYMNITRLICA
jgi:hypothetical protein